MSSSGLASPVLRLMFPFFLRKGGFSQATPKRVLLKASPHCPQPGHCPLSSANPLSRSCQHSAFLSPSATNRVLLWDMTFYSREWTGIMMQHVTGNNAQCSAGDPLFESHRPFPPGEFWLTLDLPRFLLNLLLSLSSERYPLSAATSQAVLGQVSGPGTPHPVTMQLPAALSSPLSCWSRHRGVMFLNHK